MTEIIKRTILQRTEDMGHGNFAAVIRMLATEGAAVLGSRTHRIGFAPGDDIEARIADFNEHVAKLTVPFPAELTGIGLDESDQVIEYPPLDDRGVDELRAAADRNWTPEVMAAYHARMAAEAEASRVATEAEAERIVAVQAAIDAAVTRAVDAEIARREAERPS